MSRVQRAVDFGVKRRRGEQAQARIDRSFQNADDLRSECRHCHHIRRGTMADITGPCPNCGAGIANTHSE